MHRYKNNKPQFSVVKSTLLIAVWIYNLNTSLRNGVSMTEIYLDVLIVTNIYVNYFLLKSTARISHTGMKTKRCILSSTVGVIPALVILLPALPPFLLTLIKLLSAFVIVRIAFSKIAIKQLIRLTMLFFAISFVFSGLMLLASQILKISTIIVNNYTVYFDISLLVLAITTIIAYGAVCLISYILDKKMNADQSFTVSIKLRGNTYELKGTGDTGNTLVDGFTGRPVVICNSRTMAQSLDMDCDHEYTGDDYISMLSGCKGFRLMPFRTVSGDGIIPAFLADSIIITNDRNQSKLVDAYIGLSLNDKEEEKAIFNPRLLI